MTNELLIYNHRFLFGISLKISNVSWLLPSLLIGKIVLPLPLQDLVYLKGVHAHANQLTTSGHLMAQFFSSRSGDKDLVDPKSDDDDKVCSSWRPVGWSNRGGQSHGNSSSAASCVRAWMHLECGAPATPQTNNTGIWRKMEKKLEKLWMIYCQTWNLVELSVDQHSTTLQSYNVYIGGIPSNGKYY